MDKCKFCGDDLKIIKSNRRKLKNGMSEYCQKCYRYFFINGYKVYTPSSYGSLSYVNDKEDPQNGMAICHICGKAFTKLQQHIYYAHNMTKNEYCDKFGIDRSTRMTEESYHNKMSKSAYDNNMVDQLRRVGKATRFKKNECHNYNRSFQSNQRLKEQGYKIAEYARKERSKNK